MIPQASFKLIHNPKSERPLRTSVDALTSEFVNAANKQVDEQYKNFLTAFGMAEMLN